MSTSVCGTWEVGNLANNNMGKKNRTKKTPQAPQRTSKRKRNRTEKGSCYDEYLNGEDCADVSTKKICLHNKSDLTSLTEDHENASKDSQGSFHDTEAESEEMPLRDKSVNLTAAEDHEQTTNSSQKPSANKEAESVSVGQDEDHALTTYTASHDGMTVENGDTSDGSEALPWTQQTPKVLPDGENVTPNAAPTDPSTPGVMHIGRKNRGNSVNLMLELEEAETSILVSDENSNGNQKQSPDINDKNDDALPENSSLAYLNNLYELHSLHKQNNINEGCFYTADLEKKVDQQEKRLATLEREKQEQKVQIEKYAKELFKKEQRIKIFADRVKQLENSNNYRKEVERLQVVVEQGEVEVRSLKEELKGYKEKTYQAVEENHVVKKELQVSMEKKSEITKELEEKKKRIKELEVDLENNKEKMTMLEENKTSLLNANTVLKNEAKVLKQKKRAEEDQKCHLPRNRQEEGQILSTEIRKELSNLQKELQQFKEFTCNKLDELGGRGSLSSSLYSPSGESGEESEGAPELKSPPMKKTTPPSRKQLKKNAPQKLDIPAVTLRYEGNNQPTAEASPDESGHTIPLVPGPQTYSEKVRCSTASPESSDFDEDEKARKIEGIKARRQARESKTLIFSSSITRDITRQQKTFNEMCRKSDVTFHQFNGKKASDIVRYMIPHLEEEQPSSVVFVAGGNDLPNKDIPFHEIKKIANCLVEGGLLCRGEHGVNDVFISSIMPRSHSAFQGNRHSLNNMLKEMCKEYNFTFIDNKNIVLRAHGHHDGVHLNHEGSEVLRDNLLNVLNK